MNRIKSALTVCALAAGGAALVAAAPSATAFGTASPWAGQDTNAVGGLAFFNSTGTQVFGGNLTDKPPAAYAVGLAKPRNAPDVKATLFAYVPIPGQTPDTWSTQEQISTATAYPNTAAPQPVGGTLLPVTSGKSTDKSVANFSSDLPNSATAAGYQNVYEIRQYTSNPNDGVSVQYNYADITINSTAGTWAVTYSPDQQGVATSSNLAANQTSPVNQGTTVHFTDTVKDASNNSVTSGTVQFKVNGTNSGSPVNVANDGTAQTDITFNTTGANNVTAVFSPAALSGFTGSTSNSVPFQVNKVVTNTATTLSVNPASGPAFSAVTLTATVSDTKTPPGAVSAGIVKFFDNGTQIGQASPNSSGVATLTYSGFAQGDHDKLTAQFVPTDSTSFNGSTSPNADFNAGAPVGATPDSQTIKAQVLPGSLAITTPYTANNPLNVGTLALSADGKMLSGSAQFGDGTFDTTGSEGKGSIQIVDTRAGNANWTASAQSLGLSDPSGDLIDGQNVGLTGLHTVVVPGNAQTDANLHLYDNPAANPAVAPGATGQQGLGGGVTHKFADTINGGDGSIGIYGTLTINAPTSTKTGTYTGVVVFTVA